MTSSDYAVRELTEADRARWNDFVGRNPYGDVLQAWEWGGVKSAGGDWHPACLAVCDASGAIRAGALLLKRRVPLVGSFYYAPRGPLFDDWSDSRLLDCLLGGIAARAKDDGAAFLKIDPAVPIEASASLAALRERGFAPPIGSDAQGFGGTQPRTVMVLDIAEKTSEQLLMDCKPQCRRNIRISEKKGVEVILDTTREHLKPFYELLRVTAERDGFRVRGLSYYETLWDQLVMNGLGKLALTRYEDQYLSGALCFVIGDKCWYVYGASSNEHRNVMPNYGMQWSLIEWAKAQGCSLYDFRGVSPRRRQEGEEASEVEKEDHLQGLNRFKEGFGARYVEYIGELDLVYNKAAYWLWTSAKPTAQQILRKVRGRK
jgi:lipid II:glycine glycyltransferase (peptidoglycan interpeptide bridge formation enzyme)